MKKECCRNCASARIKRIDHMDTALCPEITFRAVLVNSDESISDLPAAIIRLIDLDNFKCDYYRKSQQVDTSPDFTVLIENSCTI